MHLPKLAGYEYNEAVSYLVWKLLNLSLDHERGKIDWECFTNIFKSEAWHSGKYQNILRDDSWKKLSLSSKKGGNLHVGTMCNRQCYPAETIYYCFTCTMNPLYEICEFCFDKSKHENHIYTAKVVVRPEGRVCHCGDTSVFKSSQCASQCKNESNNFPPDPSSSEDYDELILSTFNTVLDYLIDVTIYFKEQKKFGHSVEGKNSSGKPKCDKNVIPKTVLEDSRGNIGHRECIEETKWALQIDEEDCQMNYADLTAKIARILNKPTEYGISISNMLENGTSSVTVVKSSSLSKLQKISMEFYDEGAKNHIRETKDTFKRGLVEDLIHWLYTLCLAEPVSLKTKKTLRLSMLDAWKSGLLSTKYTADCLNPYIAKINLLGGFLVSYEQRDTFPWFQPWKFENIKDDKISEVISNYNKRLADTNIPSTVSRFHALHGSRFQYILTEATNVLSRLSRYRMLKVLSTLFTIADPARQCLSAQYLDVYLAVLYSTVASDNMGFEIALMGTFSQYTFQDPKTANIAITSGFIQRTLRFAFTLMAFTSEDLIAYPPIPLYYGCKLPNETIRNRRTIICFKDICILMSTNTIPQELLENESILAAIVESFAEFNNILPLKRETSEHVEFENFDFSSYYFFFSSILIMTDGYIRSISLLTDKEVRRKIVIKLIKIAMNKEFELLGNFRSSVASPLLSKSITNNADNHSSFFTVKEKIFRCVADIIKFQVGVDAQNFFNPMSYLFKFVLQWSQCGRYEPLPETMANYLDFNELFKDKKKALYISESSLSTLVLLGQINVGFWVRNGTPITHQARMYTKYSMREFTYMSDIFNVQFSMSQADPNEFMITYLVRWGLRHWSNGFPMGDYPDPETTVSVVNQCVVLLIQLLTETKSLTIISSVDGFEKTLKAEIVHALCFKNCTYSQIMNAIPEHITKHAAFDLYLEEYTNFTPPSGLTDFGTYTLKSTHREEVDPYYIGLSSSKRYEAEKNIRLWMASREQISYDDTFVPAKKVIDSLKSTPYSRLYSISSVETFGIFLKNTLDHINKFDYESLLPTMVHLIHLCVVNNLNDFMKLFWSEFASLDTEFCYYHSIGSILYGFLLKENFSHVHGKIREIFRYLMKTAPHVDVNSYLQEQAHSFNAEILWSSNKMKGSRDGEFERKKNLARLRKEKVMKKLARQQMQFIENNSIPTTDEECSKESPADNEGFSQHSGWEFPEDSCVFCKMPCEEDVFVYFSYQEENICDHGIDFTKINEVVGLFSDPSSVDTGKDEVQEIKNYDIQCRLRLTHQAAVLRTCGHGSHISCLSNHMKSIRAAHNQTTKNVPVAYGFGLMYCPLCNGMCNSFLPKLTKANCRNAEDFFENKPQRAADGFSPLLLSTSIKAARIFEDLSGMKSELDENVFNIINQLLVNTTSNIELTLRSTTSNGEIHEISNQKLLSLRLLAGLRTFLHQNCHKGSYSRKVVDSWKCFVSENISMNLLLTGSQLIDPVTENDEMVYKKENITPASNIMELLKRRIYQDMILLTKELIKVGFYEDYTGLKPWDVPINYSDCYEKEAGYVMKSFLSLAVCLDPAAKPTLQNLCSIKHHIHHLLIQSLTVFLRRLCIICYAQYAIEVDYDPPSKFKREIDFFCSYLRLPKLENTIKDFYKNDLSGVLELTKNNLKGPIVYSMAKSLETMAAVSAKPVQLIRLPHSLSYFFLCEDENIVHRALRDDLAICLFCGKKCHIQRSVSLHGYAQGVCTNHVRNECEVISSYGIFLMVRSNAIYLSYGQRGSFYPAPYLHKHGEPDEDFKYNTPVFLDEKRYEHLVNNIVLENMIPHMVLRLTDGNSDLGGWETM